MNIAVILAGGVGKRLGDPTPKQLMKVGGHTILEHTVRRFADTFLFDELCIVSHADYLDTVGMLFGLKRDEQRDGLRLVEGGSERYISSINAIMAYIDAPDDTNILFHDAARPNVDKGTIGSVIKALEHYQAVGVGLPAVDTLWEITLNQESLEKTPGDPYTILRVPERKRYWQAQTPQGFKLSIIRDAYQRALQDPNFAATDDCSVVCRYMPEVKVHLVKGTRNNAKITYSEDLELLRIQYSEHSNVN